MMTVFELGILTNTSQIFYLDVTATLISIVVSRYLNSEIL